MLASPALDHIIERPRLIALLEDGEPRVVLLGAPAGYGKTTLARQWCARQTGPVAWYRTTRASGDVAALSVALDELLNKVVPQPGRDPKRIAAIAAVNARPLPLARALVSTYATLGREVLLVLDEWEAAGTAEADELVAHVVDELDIRVLVTSRTRPPWFTPRLTVYGEGREIGMDALAMTDEEALAVLARDEPRSHVSDLLDTARGWPAVLGLAAQRVVRELPIGSVAARDLYDYLARELLNSAPNQLRQALTVMAAAGVTELDTAKLILGDPVSAALASAVQRNLLLVDDSSSLSLHPLLRDLLLAGLRRFSSTEHAELVSTCRPLVDAAKWDEALVLAETIPDAGFVEDALSHALDELLTAGRGATLRRWVAAARRAGAHGGVTDYAEAEVSLRDAALDKAITLGELAAETLVGDQAAKAHLVAARAANLADRLGRARKNLRAAQELAVSEGTRAASAWGSLVQALDDESTEARGMLSTFETLSSGDREHKLRVGHGHLRLGLLGDSLEHKLDDAEVLLPLIGSDADPLVRSSFLNTQSTALAVAARYELALTAADVERAIADEFELEFVSRHALINRARALIGLRKVASTERALSELQRRLAVHDDLFLATNSSIERARLYITLGDFERAYGAVCIAPNRRLNAGTRGEYLAWRSLALAARGQSDAAQQSAEAAIAASRLLAVRAVARVAVCISRLDAAVDTSDEARAVFELAMSEGALDSIVMGCRASTLFARRVAMVETHRPLLTLLLAQSRDAALGRRLRLAIPRSTERSTGLSPREREIQELIAQGLTNDEISRLLFIAPSTTKVHVRHILEKLGVRSRVEAALKLSDSRQED